MALLTPLYAKALGSSPVAWRCECCQTITHTKRLVRLGDLFEHVDPGEATRAVCAYIEALGADHEAPDGGNEGADYGAIVRVVESVRMLLDALYEGMTYKE